MKEKYNKNQHIIVPFTNTHTFNFYFKSYFIYCPPHKSPLYFHCVRAYNLKISPMSICDKSFQKC